MNTFTTSSLRKTAPLLFLAMSTLSSHILFGQSDPREVRKKNFHGTINLDIRDSKSDWNAYTPIKAPEGAPNVLFVLFDDTGLASWSPFGGAINMPTLQRLADSGLIYTQWHTTALCSPTRSTLLTGRNHHLTGNAAITETADGFPRSQWPHTGRV